MDSRGRRFFLPDPLCSTSRQFFPSRCFEVPEDRTLAYYPAPPILAAVGRQLGDLVLAAVAEIEFGARAKWVVYVIYSGTGNPGFRGVSLVLVEIHRCWRGTPPYYETGVQYSGVNIRCVLFEGIFFLGVFQAPKVS